MILESFEEIPPHLEKRRVRLVISLGLYGSALGASFLLVSFMARTVYPKTPEHLDLLPSVFLSGGGWIMGAIIAGALGYLIAPTSWRPHNIFLWLMIGFGFGILLPFFSNSLMPMGTVYLNLALGIMPVGEVPMMTLDALFRAPVTAFIQGALGVFTGLLTGTLFGLGGWLIDIANTSRYPRVSRYAPYVLSSSLSILVLGIAAFGPASTLAKLG